MEHEITFNTPIGEMTMNFPENGDLAFIKSEIALLMEANPDWTVVKKSWDN